MVMVVILSTNIQLTPWRTILRIVIWVTNENIITHLQSTFYHFLKYCDSKSIFFRKWNVGDENEYRIEIEWISLARILRVCECVSFSLFHPSMFYMTTGRESREKWLQLEMKTYCKCNFANIEYEIAICWPEKKVR